MKLERLAEIVGGRLSGPPDLEISGAAPVAEAGEGQAAFITDLQHLKDLEQSRAAVILAPENTPEVSRPVIRVRNPKLAFAKVLELFSMKPRKASGISERAVTGADAVIGADCSIHALVVIGDRVRLGDNVTIYPGAFVGDDSSIGDGTVIHANVSIAHGVTIGKRVIVHSGTVIGSDGFGFVTDGGRHHKIPQVGGVIVEDDVEIGANCAIDRATLGNTIIKKGTKIDNLVQIAHNVTIGEHCLLAGQAGIAGSSKLGNYVVLAGQVGVSDHVSIGDRVMAGGKTVIVRNVEAGQILAGINAMPLRDWLKIQVVLPSLPELKKIVTRLEKQVRELKEKTGQLE